MWRPSGNDGFSDQGMRIRGHGLLTEIGCFLVSLEGVG